MKSLIHEDIFTSNNVFILIFSYLFFFFTGAAFYVDFFLFGFFTAFTSFSCVDIFSFL